MRCGCVVCCIPLSRVRNSDAVYLHNACAKCWMLLGDEATCTSCLCSSIARGKQRHIYIYKYRFTVCVKARHQYKLMFNLSKWSDENWRDSQTLKHQASCLPTPGAVLGPRRFGAHHATRVPRHRGGIRDDASTIFANALQPVGAPWADINRQAAKVVVD